MSIMEIIFVLLFSMLAIAIGAVLYGLITVAFDNEEEHYEEKQNKYNK